VLTEDEGRAIMLTWALAFLLCAVGPAVYYSLVHAAAVGAVAPSHGWLQLSPAYAPLLVLQGFASIPASEFWKTFVITLIVSGLCLMLAAWRLSRIWQDQPAARQPGGWRDRWEKIIRGTPEFRRSLAGAWLDANPFTWLAARDRQSVSLAWLVIALWGVSWAVGWAVWRDHWLTMANLLISAAVLNLALRWIIRYSAAVNLGRGRRDGSYELLLTTPLRPSDIVWGELEALKWKFRPVATRFWRLRF
jgi:hypothetical protein